jgi:endonuclease-3
MKAVKISDDHKRILEIIRILKHIYPDSSCSLNYKNILELTVATILSAQCTDARVNIVTQSLFKKYKTLKDYATADITELEQDIRSTGFYRNKAKNIKGMAYSVLKDFDGRFPKTVAEMATLPGVGRKTATAVLGEIYDISEGVTVDTHMIRLFNLLGFVDTTNAIKIEKELMELIPKRYWNLVTHLMIDHGRAVCIARRPKCDICRISHLCPSRNI